MTASESGSTWQSIWNAAVANQVAQLNCSATPTPLPCSASTALSGTNAMDLTSVHAGPALPTRIDQRLDVLERRSPELPPLRPASMPSRHSRRKPRWPTGRTPLDLGTSLGITGVTDAKLTLTMGQIPQVAFGPVGTTASTAQLTQRPQTERPRRRIYQYPALGRPGHRPLCTTLNCAVQLHDARPPSNRRPRRCRAPSHSPAVGRHL